ncbi:tetratricopeptide repeat protein [Lederbergia citrea]|uniref:tetratricopeptide repeat protein n=1 Tax=Lederbergia citrea TaxID=2833581 RepID=UPI001BCA038A|nr:tetratricopeptide repeat protein [Lederbergia citrea]MBS4176569.1 tetratricopeptide repeat protein [Lederbergia citrea]
MNNAELMLKFIEEQNLPEAEKQFNKVKTSSTDDEKFMLAQELSHYGYVKEAIELYEILLRFHPDEGELKLRIAELMIEMDEEDKAYDYLESIGHDDPNYPAALLIEADLYEMQGLYEVSEKKLLQAKEILPNEPIIDYALGELYMTQGRFLEASRSFKLLLTADEQVIAGIDINGRMAEALSAGGAFEEALTYYEKGLLNKQEINLLFGFGLTAFQAGSYKKAIKAFNQLREMDPDYHSLYLYLAQSHEHEEELEDALKAVQAGIALDEFNKDLYFYAGKLSLKLGNEKMAEQYLREALALDPEFIEAAFTLNRLLIHLERYEDVLEICAMFIQEGGGDPQLHWDAAVSHQQLEQYTLALNEYELAYNEYKHNRDFLVDFGYFLMEEGRRKDATRIFKRLADDEPTNEEWIAILDRLEEN